MNLLNNTIGTIAGVLAFISIFLWEFSIFPIAAFVCGIIGVVRAIKENKSMGMAIWGIVGGVIFLIVRIAR